MLWQAYCRVARNGNRILSDHTKHDCATDWGKSICWRRSSAHGLTEIKYWDQICAARSLSTNCSILADVVFGDSSVAVLDGIRSEGGNWSKTYAPCCRHCGLITIHKMVQVPIDVDVLVSEHLPYRTLDESTGFRKEQLSTVGSQNLCQNQHQGSAKYKNNLQ
eukprot:TRINITY_DN24255_c0_g1_i1.p1 TRINITY_DN24255_c0_g1~~TRINITY_DN24255_c0_g1_i1.p1  ORF type:complete len:163 (+),score=5.01 TRINITY_DN24255_c0_g1_i1:142-630(+)